MIELFTDNYFHIGKAHLTSGKPCQDYAISDVYENGAFAIISDGCSTGRHTDVGSRILSLSTASAILDNWSMRRKLNVIETPIEVGIRQSIMLSGMQDALGLIVQDMLSTCLYSYICPQGGIVHVQGDGVVAVKYRDGQIKTSNFEWRDNKPFYVAYKNGNLENFINAHGGDLESHRLQEEIWMLNPDGEKVSLGTKEYTLAQGLKGITFKFSQKELEDDIEFIAVFSDGVTQIDGIDWRDAVIDFLAFKNTVGAFVARRMIRGIKDFQKNGKGPIDDIACAVVRVEAKEEKSDDKDT